MLKLGAQMIALRAALLWLVPTHSLPSLLDRLSSGPMPDSPRISLELLEQSFVLTERMLGRLPLHPNTCLYRALARYALLRRAGHKARFFMGIFDGQDLSGHAWVEISGTPQGETLDPKPVVTYAYPHPSHAAL